LIWNLNFLSLNNFGFEHFWVILQICAQYEFRNVLNLKIAYFSYVMKQRTATKHRAEKKQET
jgi:hypothetical protein